MDDDWQLDAACAGAPQEWFFPEPHDMLSIARAKALCRTCPVLARCEVASRDEVHGVWAATTGRERARRRRT